MKMSKINRRQLLKSGVATGAGLAVAGGVPAFAQDLALPQGEAGQLAVIHRTEYFEDAQTLFKDIVTQFAGEHGAELDISTTNPEAFGDFLGKMSAAVKAGNPPDLAYTSAVSIAQMNLLGLLEDVTDVVEEAERRYGRIMPGISAEEKGKFNGRWMAIPFIASTDGTFIRGDKLKEAGIDPASLDTYDKRRDAALAITDPDNEFWGWGIPPSKSGDGHVFLINLIQSFGGHYTDESGMRVTFNSPETVAAYEWVKETFDRNGKYAAMLPPGIENWGDTGNNEAYVAGNIGYTHNSYSVYAKAKRDGSPVFPDTVILPFPRSVTGEKRDWGQVGGWLTIFKGSQNVDLAKQLALDLLDPENFTQMSSVAGGLFMPAYENLWTDELLAADPNFATIKEVVSVEEPFIGPSWPAKPNAAIDAIRAQGIIEQVAANVISGNMTPAEAVEDGHNKIVQIFEEGGIAQ